MLTCSDVCVIKLTLLLVLTPLGILLFDFRSNTMASLPPVSCGRFSSVMSTARVKYRSERVSHRVGLLFVSI